jgi:parallel beta-helix repeat protein
VLITGVKRSALSLNYPLSNLAYWLKTMTHKTNSRSLLFTAIGIGLTNIAGLCLSDLGATLEPPPQHLAQTPQIVYVNSSVANGNKVDGSQSAPFKTITQALQVAEPNSIIMLAAGTYSSDSGEKFPLQLKPGVSILGDSKTKGSNIVIKGGGTFISPTFARQDVTILGANSASLTGVSVTNPNPRGYGLWIESSSPTVSDNTFTGSDHDGMSVTGNSAPLIRNNYFHQNGANGITIYGISKPEVRENVFEQTGFGINIAQKASPLLVGNRLIKNRSAIVIQANAHPVLRNNVIESNTEDGVVAIANSQPDLGTKTQPGGNIFRQNGRYDINSSAAKQLLSAFGNQLAGDHLIGSIDLAGTGSATIIGARSGERGARADNHQIALNAVTLPEKEQLRQVDVSPATAAPIDIPVTSPEKEQQLRQVDVSSATAAPIDIPVPPPALTQIKPKLSNAPQKLAIAPQKLPITDKPNSTPSQLSPSATSSTTKIEIPTPPQPKTDSLTQGLPVLAPAPINTSQLLPVPNSNIPIGNNSNQLKPQVLATNPVVPAAQNPPQPPTLTAAMGFRYRVVVEAETETTQAKVRSLVPGAFRTLSNGKAIMQAGAFSDRAQADEVLQLLTSNGLKAAIEQLN